MNDKTYANGAHVIPEDEYFDLPHLSNSDLKLIKRSPAHYWSYKFEQQRPDPTPAQIAGKILHAAILEPEKFDEQFVIVPPDAPKRPTAAQRKAKKPSPETIHAVEWWDAWESQYGHATIIDPDKGKEYMAIAKTIREHPELAPFMENGKAELTFIARDPETDLPVRCRADWLTKVGDTFAVIDFKSCEDARPFHFQRSAYNFGYFQQAAYYLDVIDWAYKRPDLFLFVAFEKSPPYAVKIYEASPNAIGRGKDAYRKAMNLAKHCFEMAEFPAYDTSIEPIDYPHWAKED